jgi:tetratricopeptide (TPR) repeat protein
MFVPLAAPFLFVALVMSAQVSQSSPAFESLSHEADKARDTGHFDDAVSLYKKALQANPSWVEGWWSLGSIAYDRDDFAECAPSFLNLASLKPDSVPAWTMSGLCEYRLRNYPAALESLSHAERLGFEEQHELSRAARLHLALVLVKTGYFEKAIVTLTNLTRFDRKAPDISVVVGIAGLREPWLPSEVPESRKAVVLKLGDAMSAAMEQDVKESLQKFEAVIQEFPNDPNIRFRFAGFLAMQYPDRGVAEMKATLKLDPNHVLALVGLTSMYLKRDELPEALDCAQQAVHVAPSDFSTHLVYGKVLLAMDAAPKALPELQEATRLSPETPEAHYSLASAYTRLGRKRDAKQEQEEFKRLTKLMTESHP